MLKTASIPPANGFTLVELIVALAVASLLLGLLTEALGGITKTTRQLLTENTQQEERAVSTRFVNQALKSTLPPDPRDPGSRFVGTEQEVSFTTLPPESLRSVGSLRVRLYLDTESSGDKSVFIDAESPPGQASSPRFVLKRHRLFKNARSARFRFYENTGTETRELDRWEDATKLPSLISLAILVADDTSPISISAMPRRNVSGHCQFDNIGLSCRY